MKSDHVSYFVHADAVLVNPFGSREISWVPYHHARPEPARQVRMYPHMRPNNSGAGNSVKAPQLKIPQAQTQAQPGKNGVTAPNSLMTAQQPPSSSQAHAMPRGAQPGHAGAQPSMSQAQMQAGAQSQPSKNGVPAPNAIKAPQLQIPSSSQAQGMPRGAQPGQAGTHPSMPQAQMQAGAQAAQAMARGPQPSLQAGAHTAMQGPVKQGHPLSSPYATHRPAPQLVQQSPASVGSWPQNGRGGADSSPAFKQNLAPERVRREGDHAPVLQNFQGEKAAGAAHLTGSPAAMRNTQLWEQPRHTVHDKPDS